MVAIWQAFGAKFGQFYGLDKQTFAIPTKNRYIKTMPIDTIKWYSDGTKYRQKCCEIIGIEIDLLKTFDKSIYYIKK